jgi:hypothetical protein
MQDVSETGSYLHPSWCPEKETVSFYLGHLIIFHLKTETDLYLRTVVFLIEDRTIDNVQNCDSYMNYGSILRYQERHEIISSCIVALFLVSVAMGTVHVGISLQIRLVA